MGTDDYVLVAGRHRRKISHDIADKYRIIVPETLRIAPVVRLQTETSEATDHELLHGLLCTRTRRPSASLIGSDVFKVRFHFALPEKIVELPNTLCI